MKWECFFNALAKNPKPGIGKEKLLKRLIMQELTLNARQQYHKHSVMHRALNSLKNCRFIKAIKLILSMVHNYLYVRKN
jgi:hypothetical protein